MLEQSTELHNKFWKIFNAQDILDNGIITVCNQLALDKNIKVKMSVKEAVKNI